MKYLSIFIIILIFACKSKPLNDDRSKNPNSKTESEKTDSDSEVKITEDEKYERFVILKPIDLKTNQLKRLQLLLLYHHFRNLWL